MAGSGNGWNPILFMVMTGGWFTYGIFFINIIEILIIIGGLFIIVLPT